MNFLHSAILVACHVLLLIATPLPAQEEATESATTPNRIVVFRINGKTLQLAVDRNVSRTMPINKTTQKATVEGSAQVSAEVALDFAGGTDTKIPISIGGRIDLFANAEAGPVVAKIYGQIPFTLDLAIGFDGQREFYALPACARANTCLSITCVDTKRRRLGRRIVRGVASRVANKKLPEAQTSTSRAVEKQLVSEADKGLQKIVPKINEAFKFDETLTALAAEMGFERRISKSNNFLQLRVAPQGQSAPTPPTNQVADVLFEIWIYPAIENEELIDKISEFWDEAPDEIVELLPQNPKVEELNPKDQTKTETVDDWTVIRVGDFEVVEKALKKLSK